ncbi:MAG TPA: 2-phospho-L-lactate guanylyltransferase [Acidimicrobiales bacterium]|nr:2-phospho-L-lactate guanylyltransferase [Acidimicrobiales bacterium]
MGRQWGDVAVLVPVKAFHRAKVRLSGAMPDEERATLARSMATHVLQCAGGLAVAVVCDDPEVAAWAEEQGALVVWEPGRGLNLAVEAGVDRLADKGVRRVIVTHADLPLARDLRWVGSFSGVTLVPDRIADGTNAACVPTRRGFRFFYGAGSFAKHADEARRLSLPLRIVREPSLAHDVDLPADLLT